MASNDTQAHDFYYKGVNEGVNKWLRRCSLNYEGKVAYSYSTVIAKVIPQRGYEDKGIHTANPDSGLTLLTFDSMTSPTSKHCRKLVRASPFDVVCIPFKYGHRWDPSPKTMAEWMLAELETYSKLLMRAEHCSNFTMLMGSVDKIVAHAAEPWAKAFSSEEFRKYRDIYANLGDYAEKLKAKKRAEAAKRAANTRKVLDKWLGKEHTSKDYLDLMRTVFGNDPSFCYENREMTYNGRAALRRRLGLKTEFAYVWIENDMIRTSRHVSIDVNVAKVAMKAWALGHDMRKFQVGPYTVLKYEGDTIQIGCHRIPRENMVALYEVVMGEPFPRKEQAA